MSFESKMRKHIQKVFDENVPNPYEKVEVKKTFNLKKMLMPLGVAALACSVIVAIVLPISMSIKEGMNRYDSNSSESPTSENMEPEGGEGNQSPNEENQPEDAGFLADENFVERTSIAAAPKATMLSSLDSSFINRTAQKSLQNLDDLFKNPNNEDYVVSPASYLLGAAGLAAVSDGIDASNYGLTDPLNETKMLLEKWNCFSKDINPDTGEEEVVSKFDSGILHQQVGARYAFNDSKIASVEDEYIATSAAFPQNYRQQAQEYFSNSVKINMPVPDLGLKTDCVVSYSTLKFFDDANLGDSQKCFFTKGTDTILVNSCVYGDSFAHTYRTDVYETTKYTAFSRQVRNSNILFIVPKGNVSLEDITISQVYTEFMNNKTECMAYGYIPYFHIKNIGMDISDAIKKSFRGSEKLYSKLLEDNVDPSNIKLKMIQNADYSFEEDEVPTQTGRNLGVDSGEQAVCLNVDRPFYALCLKDGFPLFVNKVTNPGK